MAKSASDSVSLGANGVKISPIGMGAWAWGDRLTWGGYVVKEVQDAFDVALGNGITFLDTAEVYGLGTSERLIGEIPTDWRGKITLATKFFPFPWRLGKWQFRRAVEGSLKRLKLSQIDLYQIHRPLPPRPIETWLEAMADAVKAGKVKMAGVSNYSTEQTRTAYELLKARGIPLTSNQVNFSLINRKPERTKSLSTQRFIVFLHDTPGFGVQHLHDRAKTRVAKRIAAY